MLIDEKGLITKQWDKSLLRLLGDKAGEEGYLVVSEALSNSSSKIETRHWLYCLIKSPKGLLRQQFVEAKHKQVDDIIETIETCSESLEKSNLIPARPTVNMVTSDVIRMLQYADNVATEHNGGIINEFILTLAILEAGGEDLTKILETWAGPEEFKRCKIMAKNMIGGGPEKITVNELFKTYLIGRYDFKNWRNLLEKIFKAGQEETPSPKRRIWEILNSETKKIISNAVNTNNFDSAYEALQSGLNNILRRRDFYNNTDFNGIITKDKFPGLIEVNKLSEDEIIKLNRLIMESVFIGEITISDTATGRFRATLFDLSGRRFCECFKEDMASLGIIKITTYHMLYTLLGTESSLCKALMIRGIDVKKELHTVLSRQIVTPGAKRNDKVELSIETLMRPVVDIFLYAAELAQIRGSKKINEADISRAFVYKSAKTLQEIFQKDKPLDLTSLQNYMDVMEIVVEDEKEVNKLTVSGIEREINKKIRGQSQALAKVIPWIKRLHFGLRRDNRPAAVLLFLGPTGTGKTQMAKELARYVFGNEDKLIFLEMGQFQTKESMSGFVGAPPGYVGYGEGKLTNGLRDQPESVVLFDEIEKAYIEVFNALLRFADEGLISDPAGPVRDGSKCIIVMTTNAGQRWLLEEYLNISELNRMPGELAKKLADARADSTLPEQLLKAAQAELRERGFRPEFIGRVDELVTFLPFDMPTCGEIVKDIIAGEQKKLRDLKGIDLIVEEDAIEILTESTMVRSVAEGARCVPRTINDYVINHIIDKVLAGEENGKGCERLRVYKGLGINQIEVEAE